MGAFPHFGALTSAHTRATLQAPLEQRVWRYDVDKAAGVVRYRARNSEYTVEMPLDPFHGAGRGGAGAYEGMYARLREAAAAYQGLRATPAQ